VTIPAHYIEKIHTFYPTLALEQLELNQDGMNNDAVVVNGTLVCRFAKTEWAREDLKAEVEVLQLIKRYVELPIPQPDHVDEGFVSYPFIYGEPLSRNLLLRLAPPTQEKVLVQLGQFLHQLHAIPGDALAAATIPASVAQRGDEDFLALYAQVQETLFPHLWRHQRTWVHEHFAPLVQGKLSLGTATGLVHGDLGCYHVLFDTEWQQLSGVIDFGTAGLGSPAIDLAALLDTHGETVVTRIANSYPGLASFMDEARFRAGVVWLQWALAGLKHNDTGLLLAHIGSSARDIQPVGASW
jgi:aminoglycoside phosphotransferase (APT) family kinase protein